MFLDTELFLKVFIINNKSRREDEYAQYETQKMVSTWVHGLAQYHRLDACRLYLLMYMLPYC